MRRPTGNDILQELIGTCFPMEWADHFLCTYETISYPEQNEAAAFLAEMATFRLIRLLYWLL